MPYKRVLVVGTTSDYIDMIRKTLPGQALFITAHDIRKKALEPIPFPGEEVLCDLSSPDIVLHQLRQHLRSHDISLTGIVCFDCESMELAARIAGATGLTYPTLEAIQNCRDKSRSKDLWQQKGVPCPRFSRVSSEKEAGDFFNSLAAPCVLKPVDGSGSERVFLAKTRDECIRAYKAVCEDRPFKGVILEEFVEGTEYSCDVIIRNGRARLIRMTRKIPSSGRAFGTIMAYELTEFLPDNISESYVLSMLAKAASALSIDRALCMVDFIVNGSDIRFLEMTPRPGGDCLPWLIRQGMDLDMLKLAIDFAIDSRYSFRKAKIFFPLVGLRIHAGKSGILAMIDTSRVMDDPRVKDIMLKHKAGHKIELPPRDYDSWNLGHIIFKPMGMSGREAQCLDLLSKLSIEIHHDPSCKPRSASAPGRRSRPNIPAFAR